MRPIPRGTLFLVGAVLLKCSVFPEHAPEIGRSSGGGGTPEAGANGGVGATDGGGGAAAGGSAGSSAAGGSGGTLESGGMPGSGGSLGSGGSADSGDATTPDGEAPLDGAVRTVSYVASVADCIEAVSQPQTGSCLSYSTLNDGPNELWVDIRRAQRRAFTIYLLFPLDSAIAGRVVDSVELQVTVTTYKNAAGSGADVWEVYPFTAPSLYAQTPARVATTPLATTPGAALQGQTVVYALPVTTAKPNTPLYLSLSLPAGDGTGYWGTNGDPSAETPPKLIVTYH